jgi:DNA polymerase-1
VADPLKSGVKVDARRAFGPRYGYVWYCIDYSQLELRIFAERSGGQLKEAFLEGRDPHNETREAVPYLAGLEPGEGRKKAKNTNFTIINTGGPHVLYKKYAIPLTEGKIIIREFKEQFPETVQRQREAENFALKHGYIETLTGRKINVDLKSRDDYGKPKYAYRATSYDIQGSAADFIKLAMLQTMDFLRSSRYDAHLVLSIHDELVFEIAKEHSYKHLIRTLKKIMENVGKPYMSIPLECEVQKTTTNWSSEAKVDVVL